MTNNIKHSKDLHFVRKILDGDVKAWNRFVQSYSDRIWNRAWELCSEVCGNAFIERFCVFQSIKAGGVQPSSDDRPGCDEGLEIYAFIFDNFYNRKQGAGKLKFYDGRSKLDTFVIAVLRGHLRDDWIRHNRRLRVDQITRPQEIKNLSATEQKVFDQMVMQRGAETIAKNLGLPIEKVENAQRHITHELMTHDHLHLILSNPEQALEDDISKETSLPQILPMRCALERLWDMICSVICELPDNEKILLDMAFTQALDAERILHRCEEINIKLPVVPHTGCITIHSIYQSIDAILKKLGTALQERFPRELENCRDSLDDESVLLSKEISIKGLKELLRNMGIKIIKATNETNSLENKNARIA